MRKLISLLLIAITFFNCQKSWDYQNQDKWSEEYSDCAGKYQSPINIDTAFRNPNLKPLFIDYYKIDKAKAVFNKRFIKITNLKGTIIAPDSASTWGHSYVLTKIFFHTPSEHTIKDRFYPAEIQFLNVDTNGNVLILAVFITNGVYNPSLDKILNALNGDSQTFEFDPTDLIPFSVSYWHYIGSLTFPPCTQNVQWFILKQPIEADAAQIEKLIKIMGKNNRQLQPLNDRIIYEF